MFCYQCQENVMNKGCTVRGVCGKTDDVATLQDLLIYLLKGISFFGNKANEINVRDEDVESFILEGLFTTITNVNFDEERTVSLIDNAFFHRDKIKKLFLQGYRDKYGEEFEEELPDAAQWHSDGGIDAYLSKGKTVGILATENEDIRSLQELLIYGLKGMAAYADHAKILGKYNWDISRFIMKALATTLETDVSVEDYIALVLEAGKYGVDTMALLDEANTETFGNPEPTQVFTGRKKGPGILVSGHELRDLEEILKQTEGTEINVYTHGEMLPANAYPKLKQYKHLAGNFGTSWYNQQKEFEQFQGAIVMTTNCIQKPKDSYKNNIFTTNLVAWPDVKHIPDRIDNKEKDWSAVIEKSKEIGDLDEIPGKEITIGFARETLLGAAEGVINLIKEGKIKRFVVMAGCDGRHKERDYFTQVAQNLPKDTIILTAGCAKYRYNMLNLGNIEGIPRVLDAGQCNDSYSLAYIALKLKEAVGAENINDLPLSFDIGWYEQKAVIVLLGLLYLGVKGIRLGPTLPAFLSPNVAKILVDNFDIKLISTPEEDIEHMMAGH